MRERPRKVFFDGACRPNPGRMAAAVVVRGVVHHFPDLGHGSNSDAEWLALIHALRIAQAEVAGPFDLLGDSAVVVNQANGVRPCRSSELLAHRELFLRSAAHRPPARIRHVPRSQNLAGIALDRFYAGGV